MRAHQPSVTNASQSDTARSKPSRTLLMLVNAWLVFHLFGIIVAPATVGPSSETARRSWEVVAPYLQVLYLNHGFHYFAPEPGGSTLIGYTLNLANGETLSGQFPNTDIAPRLLYHRHFMLSEYLGNARPEWQHVLIRAYARNLLREHQATSVSLTRIRHALPRMERIRAGGSLADGDLYEEELLGVFQWDEL